MWELNGKNGNFFCINMGTVNSVRYTIGKLWYMVPVGVPFPVNLSCFLLEFYGNQKYGIRLGNYGIRCRSGWDFPVPFLSLHNTVSSSPMAEPWVGVACPKANPHYWRSRLMKEKEELNRNWESTLSWIKNWRCEERLRANQENNHFYAVVGPIADYLIDETSGERRTAWVESCQFHHHGTLSVRTASNMMKIFGTYLSSAVINFNSSNRVPN